MRLWQIGEGEQVITDGKNPEHLKLSTTFPTGRLQIHKKPPGERKLNINMKLQKASLISRFNAQNIAHNWLIYTLLRLNHGSGSIRSQLPVLDTFPYM